MKNLLTYIFAFCFLTCIAQNAVPVFESTLKVGGLGEEKLYYGFAEGDQLVFDFEEINGKEMKEIEIAEYPSSSKFMDYKSKKIQNKIIPITRTGIYVFRLSNGAIPGRICRVKIQRIPGSEATKNFNTSVYWNTIYDTTYTPVQEQYLVRRDTVIEVVTERTEKVSSQNAINGNPNKTVFDITLPAHTIAWSYYIGVGSEGKAAYEKGKQGCLKSAAAICAKLPGYGPMAALALYGIAYFNQVQGADNVKYRFMNTWDDALAFKAGQSYARFKEGDVVNDFSRMNTPLSGTFYLGLLNDNVMEPIDVFINVTAIKINEQWGTRTVQRMHVASHEEPYLKS